MRYTLLSIVLVLAGICGCGAGTTGADGALPDDLRDDDGTGGNGPWFDGNGDPVDENPDVFVEVERFTYVATTIGAGAVDPSAGTFEGGEVVTITATPESGWRFDHWEGDASGTDAVATIEIEGDTAITAWFVNIPGPPEDGGGTAEGDGDGDDDGDDGDGGTETDPGSDFTNAAIVDLSSGSATVNETLAQASDVHVYDLGDMSLGDRIIVSCQAAAGSQLDPMIALFDADGYRVFWNDDVNLLGGDYDSSINDLIRHSSAHHYLVVTSTDYEETIGAYRLTVEHQSDAGTPQVSGQTIVIDIDGQANVIVAGQNWGSFAAPDAAALSASFAGQTDALIQAIISVVEADYATYDMTVLTTDDPTPAGEYTTVYLGGDSDMLFGIADNIDFYNGDQDDNCVVFFEAFSGLSNDLTAMGTAIGNVISHEVGHDLGLMHTTDVTELMDTTGAASTLLVDQGFGTADVFDFPIGFQNAPLLLEESLGLSARIQVIVEDGHLRCGTCGATLYKPHAPVTAR